MSETLLRHWNTLVRIPPYPRKVTADYVLKELEAEGFKTTLRTVQRDLHMLSQMFPITLDDRDKPFGWSWMQDASAYSLPGMTPSVALSMQMAERFLAPLFPKHQFDVLMPYFNQAMEVLNRSERNQLKTWNKKVSIVPRGLQLQAAEVNPQVLEVVYEALLNEEVIEIEYYSRSHGQNKEYSVKPLGITYRDTISYLVARINDYDNEVLLSLHRIQQAKLTGRKFDYPVEFDLQAYIDSGKLGYLRKEALIPLKIRIQKETGFHLMETPLSNDQTIEEDGEFWLVQANVQDTSELRWWISAMGANVEVLEPQSLRDEVVVEIVKLNTVYNS